MIDELGLEPFTQGEFGEWAATREWRFAKTMPHIPHYYTMRKWSDQPPYIQEQGFERAITTVRKLGVDPERWGRYIWVYYHHQGYKYWTTPDDKQGLVTVLNRTFSLDALVDVVRQDPSRANLPYSEIEALARKL